MSTRIGSSVDCSKLKGYLYLKLFNSVFNCIYQTVAIYGPYLDSNSYNIKQKFVAIIEIEEFQMNTN